MTRKDYVLIAQAIWLEQDMPDDIGDTKGRELIRLTQLNMARSIALSLRADNPRFDREQFMRACGFDD